MNEALATVIENIVNSLEERGYDVNKIKIADDQIIMWFITPFNVRGELSFNPKSLGIV